MEKQTKNILTREGIEKELRFDNTASIRALLVLCAVFSPFLLLLTFWVVGPGAPQMKSLVLKIVWCVFMGAFTSSPIWILLLGLRRFLVERKWLGRGEFDVVTREMSYKSEKQVHRHIEERLHFPDFDAISVGHTLYQLASQEDVFYIVHYKTKKEIKLLYPAKMYEYKS